MQRNNLVVGSFEVNCSILSKDSKAWIVDPGNDAERIISFLEERKLKLCGILLTHAHFDHIGGVPELQKRFPKLPVYLGEDDIAIVGHPFNQYPPDYPPVKIDGLLPAASLTEILGAKVMPISTPGHTPGGVSYFFPNFGGAPLLLSGDTLFAGSAGRTDLPGGDHATLMQSLEKLKELPDECTVVPGHGPTTTIATEKRSNPFLA